jgi:hypothetical protein
MRICSPKKYVRDRTTPKSNGVSGSMRGQHMLQLVIGNEGASRAVDVDTEPCEYLLLGRLRIVVMAGVGICGVSGLSVLYKRTHSCCRGRTLTVAQMRSGMAGERIVVCVYACPLDVLVR